MCISPILIKNPNCCLSPRGVRPLDYNPVARAKDCSNAFLQVPCGICPDCVRSRQNAFIQRANLMFSDHWCFFGTLTYNDEMIPRVTSSTGDTFTYADLGDFSAMIKRLRRWKSIPVNTKFIYVSELGGLRHRPHFHFLMFIPKNRIFDSTQSELSYCSILERQFYSLFKRSWCRNVGSRKFPKYVPLFTYHERFRYGKKESNYDLHFVRPYRLNNDKEQSPLNVSYYITKYVLKFDDFILKRNQYLHETLPLDEYHSLRRIINPRVVVSKHFGDSPSYASFIRKGIDITLKSTSRVPFYFINEYDYKLYPLCKYLRDKFVTVDDWLDYSDLFPSSSGDLSTELSDNIDQPDHFFTEYHLKVKKICDMNKIYLSLRKNYLIYDGLNI